MDLTEAVVTVVGGLILTLGTIAVAWIQRGRKRADGKAEPEQEAAAVLDPQREYVDHLREQVEELQRQLRECYAKRNDAVERAARLEERLRALRREGP